MLDWQIDDDYESWTAGSPEFEFVAWHWTGQWIYNGQGGKVPVLAEPFFSCTSGDYPSTDPRDWYYNSPPAKHYASEYGSTGIQVLNGAQATAYPQGAGIPILMITENDDEGCIDGAFPSAWDPDPLGNDDDFVGWTDGDNLISEYNVSFTEVDYPIAHGWISFQRRY